MTSHLATLLLIVLFGGLVATSMMSLGLKFMPSVAWVTGMGLTAKIFGGLVAAAAFYAGWRGRKNIPQIAEAKRGRRILIAIFAPLVIWACAWQFVLVAVPMAVSALAGHETRLKYLVLDPNHGGARGCNGSVIVQDFPSLPNSLCDLPLDRRMALQPGDTVWAEGRGTDIGVFYRSVVPGP